MIVSALCKRFRISRLAMSGTARARRALMGDRKSRSPGISAVLWNLWGLCAAWSEKFAELFLFPNDKEDGDFELLLEHIVNEEHTCLLKCFEGYEKCVAGHVDNEGNPQYITPNRKAKIYAYLESIKKSKKELERFKNKKEFFFDNPKYWNLEAEYLLPLKQFLLNVIQIWLES